MTNCFQETLANHSKYYIIKSDNHHASHSRIALSNYISTN